MRLVFTVLLAWSSFAAAQCVPERSGPPEPKPDVVVEPVPEDDDCTRMCRRLEELDCGAAWGIEPEDSRCLDFCRQAEQEGPSVCPRQVATATSCEQADELSQSCEGPP